MTVDGIHGSVQKKEPFYSPEPLPSDRITVTKGTRIVLCDIKRQRRGRGRWLCASARLAGFCDR